MVCAAFLCGKERLMVFNKLSGVSAVLGQNAAVLASIFMQAMKNKGDTCIIEYHGEEKYSLVVTCLNADDSSSNWRWNEYFSFDFFRRTHRLYTIDCGVNLADLDVGMFKEYYLQIGGADWERIAEEKDRTKNFVQMQAF